MQSGFSLRKHMLTCIGKSNFAATAVRNKVNKDLKVIELKGIRDLFGRLLHLSTVKNVDLEKLLLILSHMLHWHT